MLSYSTCCLLIYFNQYWYEAEEPQKTASLEVAVNGRYLLEDSYGISGQCLHALIMIAAAAATAAVVTLTLLQL